jgi:hypothetical protein
MLVDDTKLNGFTPEAYEIIEDNNKWLNRQNLIAKAFLMEGSVQAELDSYFIPSKKEQNITVFTELESAITWLKDQFNT